MAGKYKDMSDEEIRKRARDFMRDNKAAFDRLAKL